MIAEADMLDQRNNLEYSSIPSADEFNLQHAVTDPLDPRLNPPGTSSSSTPGPGQPNKPRGPWAPKQPSDWQSYMLAIEPTRSAMPPPVTHNTSSNTYWNTNQQWRWESQWSQHTWQESPNQPSSGSQHLDSIAWTNQYQTTPINQPPICDPSQENTTLESPPNPPNHHTTALDNITNSPFEQPAPAWRGGFGSSSEASGWRGALLPPLYIETVSRTEIRLPKAP